MSSAGDFVLTEIGLAREWGLNRSALKKWRSENLQNGIDWVSRGKTVRLTRAAAAWMRTSLLGKKAGSEGMVNGNGQSGEDGGAEGQAKACTTHEEELVVEFAGFRNRRVVRGFRKNGELVLVRVRDAGKFRPGMGLRAAFEAGLGWVIRGRHPRFVGRY